MGQSEQRIIIRVYLILTNRVRFMKKRRDLLFQRFGGNARELSTTCIRVCISYVTCLDKKQYLILLWHLRLFIFIFQTLLESQTLQNEVSKGEMNVVNNEH